TLISQRGKLADSPAWSTDSETLYFDSNASGKMEVYRKVVTGGEPENLGAPTATRDAAVLDLSSDGHWLLTNGLTGENRYDLYLRSLGAGGDWKAWAVGQTSGSPTGSFSPDSHWIVYTSDDSGRVEAYLAPVDGGPSIHRWPISSGGGFEPRFSAD